MKVLTKCVSLIFFEACVSWRMQWQNFCFQAEVYAGSLFVNQILGWDVYLSTALILAVTAVYTIGGM